MKPSVRVRFFATAREAVGASVLDRAIPPGGSTIEAVLSGVVAQHPALAPVLRGSRFVRNGRYVRGPGARVVPGDQIGVHPPYSGG